MASVPPSGGRSTWWAQQVRTCGPCKARLSSSQTSPGNAWRGADLLRYSLNVVLCCLAQVAVDREDIVILQARYHYT